MSKRIAVFTLALVFVTSATNAEPAHRRGHGPSTFEAWFEGQLASPAALAPPVIEAAHRYRYVFVAGFLNEGFQIGYFNENRKALLDIGVGADAIHIVFPSSANAVEESVAMLQETIPAFYARGTQPLVIIGHSKGAIEALAFMLASPAFAREHVKALFLVQGALGGSGIADYITGTGHPLDDRMSIKDRTEFTIAAEAGKLLDRRIDRGFQSLTHTRAAALWEKLLPRPGGPGSPVRLPPGLGDNIYFICSHRAANRVSPLLGIEARYLGTYYGDNDGLVEVKDQQVAGIGKVLAILDADHVALTIARPISDRAPRARRAFTFALLMQLAAMPERSEGAPAVRGAEEKALTKAPFGRHE